MLRISTQRNSLPTSTLLHKHHFLAGITGHLLTPSKPFSNKGHIALLKQPFDCSTWRYVIKKKNWNKCRNHKKASLLTTTQTTINKYQVTNCSSCMPATPGQLHCSIPSSSISTVPASPGTSNNRFCITPNSSCSIQNYKSRNMNYLSETLQMEHINDNDIKIVLPIPT